jgi:DNA-binding CsgD family transcriptional regulator
MFAHVWQISRLGSYGLTPLEIAESAGTNYNMIYILKHILDGNLE